MSRFVHKYLMALPEAELDYPFGTDIHVYKVQGKIFAIYSNDKDGEGINLKCDPVLAEQLRSIFTEVKPGYHMNKKTLEYSGFNRNASNK